MLSNKYRYRVLLAIKRYQSALASTPKAEEIKIPMRIKRGPTDILKALASTVKEDPTSFHYKFHDDPYLLPSTEMSKQVYSLSKEAGREAAKYLITKFPTLFMYDQDEPRLNSWRPQARPSSEGEKADESLLLDRLDKCWVSNCIEIYERLKQENKPISHDSQMKLLELLCYYNCDEPIETDWTEKTFYRSFLSSPQAMSEWKTDGAAMTLFEELENKDSRAYSAVICGMAKFKNPELCRSMYEKMLDANLKPDINIYHALLICVKHMNSESDEEWSSIENIFKNMRLSQIQPTVKTFNLALLAMIRNSKKCPKAKERCMEIFREMTAMKIEPSLTTYYCILYFNEKSPNIGSYFDAVLKQIENKEHEMIMNDDNLFFPYAMGLASGVLQNKDLAYRLHRNVLKIGKNYQYLNDFEAENYYYEQFFTLLSRTEETTKFLEAFNSLVPHVYSPRMRIMDEIVSNLEMSGAQEYLPQIFTTSVHLGYAFNRTLLQNIVNAMYRATNVHMDTKRAFAETAFQVKETIDAQFNVRQNFDGTYVQQGRIFKWQGKLIAQLAVLCARGGQFKRSFEIFEKLIPPKSNEDLQAMVERGTFPERTPDMYTLVDYVRLLVDKKQFEKCYGALKYMAEAGYEMEVRKWVSVVVKMEGLHQLEKKLFNTLLTVKGSQRLATLGLNKVLPRRENKKIIPKDVEEEEI